MSKQVDIAIVGGGAAGMAAAISAARSNPHLSIVILEKNPRVGKKLLATGNGRCNLTNQRIRAACYHGDVSDGMRLLSVYPPQAVVEFFQSMGVLCREEEEGRTYPYNGQASAVLDALRKEMQRLHIQELCNFSVQKIERRDFFALYSAEGEVISARRVILACGGKASPQLSSDGLGFLLAKSMGHSVTPLVPALAPVRTDPGLVRPLKRVRVRAAVSLSEQGNTVQKENGEVQFVDAGLSGICIFQMSHYASKYASQKKLEIVLDLLPEYSERQISRLIGEIAQRYPCLPAMDILSGVINKRVGQEVVRRVLKEDISRPCRDVTEKYREKIVQTAKSFRFPVMGIFPWKQAQVTSGGIPLKEVSVPQMESKKWKGLYLVGELLNIDGICGGYNLHWAWSSGLAAGKSCAADFGGNPDD